jgi:hypothetical protein
MSTHHSSSSSSSSATSVIVDRLLTRSLPSTREDYFIIQQKSKTAADSAADDNTIVLQITSSENCCNSSQNNKSATTNNSSSKKKSSSKKSQFESLSTDITSHILSYLHPTELYNISLTSWYGYGMFNCDLLWRCNFSVRWNCDPDFDILDHHHHNRNNTIDDATASESENSGNNSSSSSNNGGFWKKCFINSYTNPHDLWVRHWNCVYPEDVTIVAGRTVIPTNRLRIQQQQQQLQQRRLQQLGVQEGKVQQQERNNEEEEILTKFQKEFDSPMLRYCPTCRYYPTTLNSTATSNNNIGYYSNEVVNEAVNAELCYANHQLKWHQRQQQQQEQQQEQDDPIETAEIVATAHALLNNSSQPSSSIRRRRSYDNATTDAATGGGRYGTLHGGSSISKTIYYATQYSVAKWCRHLRMIADNHNNDEDEDDDDGDDGGGQDEFTTKTCSSSLLDRFNNNIISNNNEGMQRGFNTEDIQSPPPTQSDATFAFECASTYNRTIRTCQYQSSGIQFLSDAVFFNVHSSSKSSISATKRDQQKLMMDELRHDLNNDSSSIRELGSNFETSHHTWHIIRLTNPDFIRPITFRAYIQCPDAFTVYPSEGYIRPGETVYVTLGVTMRGSMMNEAFERLDVEREEVDPKLARVYATEGHLPFVPFAIRYMFAPPVPVVPSSDYQPRPRHGGGNHAAFGGGGVGPATRAQESVLDHLWENIKSEADVRTIYISAHINNNYEFEEFQHATLSPFHVTTRTTEQQSDLPLTTNMPQILHKSPELFSIIQNLKTETEQSASGDAYRTEKKCVLCKRDWGPQSELLGRAYLLRRLECQKHALRREQHCADFERTMRMIPTLLRQVLLSDDTDKDAVVVEEDADSSSSRMLGLNRISQLLYCIHREHILPMKGRRLVSREERQWYTDCERYIDETYADIQQILVESLPEKTMSDRMQQWKRRGVYATSKCTELVGAQPQPTNTSLTYKSEPKYLRKLTSLDYNPFGMANLGKQEDPNHQDSAVSMHTDMFKNDALKSWVIAQLMMGNPKVLIGHGVYDRVRKPGSIIRCPSFPVDAYFRMSRPQEERLDQIRKVVKKLDAWVSVAARFGWKPKKSSSASSQQKYFGFKGINFEFNEQDPDGLDLIVFGQQRFQINFQTSMAHYISNVPLPGQGKLLLLSSPKSKDDDNFSISTGVLYTKVQPYANLLHPSMREEENQEENNEEESQLQQSAVRDRNNQQNDQEVLAMNLIMLIATHMGWTIDDDYKGGFLLVDRRLLIACQWFSNTIMTASLLASLLSRKILLINPFPVDGVMQVGWFGSGGVPSKTFPVHTATSNLTR